MFNHLIHTIHLSLQICPIITSFVFIIIFFIIVAFLYWMIIVTLWELQYEFSQLYNKSGFKRFINPSEHDHMNLSLLYKVYSVPATVFKILLYFILVIISFLTLRIFRLGTVIDVYKIFYSLTYSSLITKLYLLIIILFYFYLLKTYVDTFSQRLYFHLKTLYIYLLQVGGWYDVSRYKPGDNKNSYIDRWFKHPIESLHSNFFSRFYDLYKTLYTIRSDLNISLYEFFIKKEGANSVPEILVAPFYFLQISTFSDTRISVMIKNLLKKSLTNIWTILRIFPIFIIFFTAVYEYYIKDGILTNIYTILLLMFFYKIYLNLLYFFVESSSYIYTTSLCICYYVVSKLHLKYDKKAASHILAAYSVSIRKQHEIEYETYIKTGLDMEKTYEFIRGEEYTQQLPVTISSRIEKVLSSSIILSVTHTILYCCTEFFYDQSSFNMIWVKFRSYLSSISFNNIYENMFVLLLIIILNLFMLKNLCFYPAYYLIILFLPITLIYILKLIKKLLKIGFISISYFKLSSITYITMLCISYICYIKHINIIYMNEILWEYGYTIIQHFTIQEKITFFKEYLNYQVYNNCSYLDSYQKRQFLSMIDFNYIGKLIDEKTTLTDLKQLANDYLELQQKLLVHLSRL